MPGQCQRVTYFTKQRCACSAEGTSAVHVLAVLADDSEFAVRWRTGNPSARPLVAYFVERGLNRETATTLAMAYIVGSAHALNHLERELDRIK